MTAVVNMGFIEKERDNGNIEYKLRFESMDDDKINKYATQMKFRLIEGNGEAIYIIGVQDNGQIVGLPCSEIDFSINIIHKIRREIDADVKQIRQLKVNSENKVLIITLKAMFNIEDIFVLTT